MLLDGLESAALRSASRAALNLVADDMATAETDIPWAMRDTWPPEVAEAAARLRDRFVPEHQHQEPYMQTDVRSTADPAVRDDFITMAPHAYDATFWRSDYTQVASLSDEGTSFAIWLTDHQRDSIAELVGADRVVTLADWRRAHPSFWRMLLDQFKTRGNS